MHPTHCQEPSVRIEGEFGLHLQVAALVVAEETVAAVAAPAHRPAEPPRRPGDQGVFGKEEIPRAEIAAHVTADAAYLLRGNAQYLREVGAQLGQAATAAGMQGIAARGVVFGSGGARFHRHAGDPRRPGF